MTAFQVLYVLCFTRPRYQVSVYRTTGPLVSDSILSAGLEETEEDDSDPFIPQERIFSKYAAMLYTSNNQGRSFEEFKEAKFCPSCGEKVGNMESLVRNFSFLVTDAGITKTRPCNIRQYFTALKMIIFR